MRGKSTDRKHNIHRRLHPNIIKLQLALKVTKKPKPGHGHIINTDSLNNITIPSIEFSFRKSISDRILAKSTGHISAMTYQTKAKIAFCFCVSSVFL